MRGWLDGCVGWFFGGWMDGWINEGIFALTLNIQLFLYLLEAPKVHFHLQFHALTWLSR